MGTGNAKKHRVQRAMGTGKAKKHRVQRALISQRTFEPDGNHTIGIGQYLIADVLPILTLPLKGVYTLTQRTTAPRLFTQIGKRIG
jgi:hypothetical protein